MKRIFVDTSAWCAIEDKSDIHHSEALQFVDFHNTIEQMARAGILHIEQISKALGEETWKIFERFNTDKEWSFTDQRKRFREDIRERKHDAGHCAGAAGIKRTGSRIHADF